MFKNERRQCFEIFSAQVPQDKQPAVQWSHCGPVQRVMEKQLRSFVLCIDGDLSSSQIHFPKDSEQKLGLRYQYLLLQIFIQRHKDFSLKICIQDQNRESLQLNLSTVCTEVKSASHDTVNLPLGLVKRDVWLNLCVDVVSFVTNIDPSRSFHSLLSISVCGSCRMRRMFTMRQQIVDNTDDYARYNISEEVTASVNEVIPKQYQLTSSVPQLSQVINYTKVNGYMNIHRQKNSESIGSEAYNSDTGYESRQHESIQKTRQNGFSWEAERIRGHHSHTRSDSNISLTSVQSEDRDEVLYTRPHPPAKSRPGRPRRPARIKGCSSGQMDEEVTRINQRRENLQSEESGLSDASSRCTSECPEESDASSHGSRRTGDPVDVERDSQVYSFSSHPKPVPVTRTSKRHSSSTQPASPNVSNRYDISSHNQSAFSSVRIKQEATSNGRKKQNGGKSETDELQFPQNDFDYEDLSNGESSNGPRPSQAAMQAQFGGASPRASQIVSIRTSELREISLDELRTSRNLDESWRGVGKREKNGGMKDLTESYERNMLLDIQRDSSDSEDGLSEGGGACGGGGMERLEYCRDEESQSSDDMSTLKSPKFASHNHHSYREEMRMIGHDGLMQSNPRDWDNNFMGSPSTLISTDRSLMSTDRSISQHLPLQNENGSTRHSREKLNLQFDPDLDCFYDPKTRRYYELL